MDKPPRRPRLFAGIALDDAMRFGCASVAARLEAHGFPARYEAPEKLHITLAFLGNVDPDRVADVDAALAQIASKTSVFTLTLDRLGAFPHERKPSIVYIGSHDQGQAYRELAERTRETYESHGFFFQDDAIAHVTIARVKRDAKRLSLPQLDIEPMHLSVTSIALFESIPTPETTRYEIRTTANLT